MTVNDALFEEMKRQNNAGSVTAQLDSMNDQIWRSFPLLDQNKELSALRERDGPFSRHNPLGPDEVHRLLYGDWIGPKFRMAARIPYGFGGGGLLEKKIFDPSLFAFVEPVRRVEPQRVSAAQIHAELYAEAEVAVLAEPEPFTEPQPTVSERVATLRDMGFLGQPDVLAFQEQELAWVRRKNDVENQKHYTVLRSRLALKFPNVKFIRQDALRKVTDKYQLEINPVNEFIGTIPESNVQEMAHFNRQLGNQELPQYKPTFRSLEPGKYYIAAPEEQFKLKDRRNIAVPQWLLDDPIVLYPALDGFLIVTAWGDEASDSEVLNERHN